MGRCRPRKGIEVHPRTKPSLLETVRVTYTPKMQCCLGCLMLLGPRLTLFVLFLTSNWLGRAYESNLWGFLGFLFLPWTTLAYAYAMNEGGGLQGPYLALWIIALLTDLFFTRQNSSKDSGTRVKVTKIMRGKPDARTVDAKVIDIDREE